MKTQILTLLFSTLLLSGCATGRVGSPSGVYAGASIGGTLGNAVGGLIGESNGGWRGGYRGSAIGTIVGTIAGAAVGNALTTPRDEKDSYYPEAKTGAYSRSNVERTRPYIRESLTHLKIRNIRFIDDSRTRSINAGESSKVIFEVMNEGNETIYNVVPLVEQLTDMKYIGISPSVMIEKINPGEGIRYTATIYAGVKLRDGEVTLRVAVSDENGSICDSLEFTVPAHSR